MSARFRRVTVPVYDSAQRPAPILHEVSELFRYRDLLTQLISRNIKTRYKRSVLGVAWTMLNPLMTMAVMALVFSAIFAASVPHYPVYVLSGLILWNFFAQTTSSITSELVWGGSLLSRVYVPKTVFAFSALGTGLVNLAFALIPLALIMLATGTPITPAMLVLPLPLLLASMFALGVGLFLSTLALRFGDVAEMYQILLTAWLYFTPVMYPVTIVPESYRWLFALNPVHHLLAVFRAPIHGGHLPELPTLGLAGLIATLTLVAGFLYFARHADEITYRV